LLKTRNGAVLLNGQDIARMPTKLVATKVGLLPQSSIAPEGITVNDLVSRGRYPYHRFSGTWSAEDQSAVDHALQVTGMTALADRPVDELSGGQRQRAWIALTLAQQTGILLLDEPTTYLDVAYQLEVLDLLSDLNITEGTTIVMVLHDVNLAARYADWILAMHEGRCEALGAPSEILTEGLVQQVFGIHAAMIADPRVRTAHDDRRSRPLPAGTSTSAFATSRGSTPVSGFSRQTQHPDTHARRTAEGTTDEFLATE
jgi:iron complex transport system ATP-binding protein